MANDKDTYQSKLEKQYREYIEVRNTAFQFTQLLISLLGLVGVGFLIQNVTNILKLSTSRFEIKINTGIVNALSTADALTYKDVGFTYSPSDYSVSILIFLAIISFALLADYVLGTYLIYQRNIQRLPDVDSMTGLSERVDDNKKELDFAKFLVSGFGDKVTISFIIAFLSIYGYLILKKSPFVLGFVSVGVQLLLLYLVIVIVTNGFSILVIINLGKVARNLRNNGYESFDRSSVYGEYESDFGVIGGPVLLMSTVIIDLHLLPYLYKLLSALFNSYTGLP